MPRKIDPLSLQTRLARRSGGGAGTGDVLGPASSTDEAVARFDGATGKRIQSGGQVYLSDAGVVTHYPPGVTPATTAADAAYSALVPNGTAANYEVWKSWRPETLPDYGRRVTVAANPFGAVDDVVHAQGWNVTRNAALPMMWRATECYYDPDGTGAPRFEDHVAEGGWPGNAWWFTDSPRRAISVEVCKVPAGLGGLVNIGCDADLIQFQSQSTTRKRVADGGSGGPTGEWLRAFQSTSDGSASLWLSGVGGTPNSWRTQVTAGGAVTAETSDGGTLTVRTTGAMKLGHPSGTLQFETRLTSGFGGLWPTIRTGAAPGGLDLEGGGSDAVQLRLSTGTDGINPYVEVSQGGGVGAGSVRLAYTDPKIGLFKSSRDFFIYYDTGTGKTVMDGVFGSVGCDIRVAGTTRIATDGTGIGFFGATPVAKPTGVAVTAAGVHAALVSLGLIAA